MRSSAMQYEAKVCEASKIAFAPPEAHDSRESNTTKRPTTPKLRRLTLAQSSGYTEVPILQELSPATVGTFHLAAQQRRRGGSEPHGGDFLGCHSVAGATAK